MAHTLKSCELDHAGYCIFCGKKRGTKQWLKARKKDGTLVDLIGHKKQDNKRKV